MDYQKQECVIQFLMGLIESYTYTWTQILMMDPLPPIAKVFALVVQEERQYAINQGMSPSSSPLVFGEMPLPSANASLTNFNLKPKHDCSLYSYCGLQGHYWEVLQTAWLPTLLQV